MLELNIQDLRKKALLKFSLKPEGHIFSVRKMTQGDELKLSELYRKRTEVLVKANELQKESIEETKKKKPNFDKIEADTQKLAKEIEKLEEQVTKVRASVFDDGTPENKLGIALYRELDEELMKRLLDHIVDGEPLENKPDGDAS